METISKIIDSDMHNLEKKNIMPKVKSSLFFEELYSDPIFGWRVPPYPLMGNDLENLIRLELLQTETKRRIVNLEAGTGAVLLRLLETFPDREIVGLEEKADLVKDTNHALEQYGLKSAVKHDNPSAPAISNNDILVTAMNVINLEQLIQYLLNQNFSGDLIAYRFHAPGPKPYKVYKHGTYDWIHYKFEDIKIADWRKSGLAVVLGTQRYITIHTDIHCNKDTKNLQAVVSDDLKEWLNVKIARKEMLSGGNTSVELSFNATGPHVRSLRKGYVEIFDDSSSPASRLEVIVSAIPMVEPGLARWVSVEDISLKYIGKFLSEENIHAVSNWAASGMTPPYDYY
ncbi:hypothetical protein [Cytobacillus oceanisediminis]|uniref:hypothetical protein n=1 Tax=Cytobacillus oceanisediminis TaxID=665099 RepID=UPI00203C9DF3|nr:hypothetical protein [Cytobacillus oceanisediminis]MCM3393142.1 hypothetical protein [Cytobacillus oceanisediminis]